MIQRDKSKIETANRIEGGEMKSKEKSPSLTTTTLPISEPMKQDPLNIEHWYQLIECFTFPTHFVELSYAHARTLICYHEDPHGKYNKFKSDRDLPILDEISQILDNAMTKISQKKQICDGNDGIKSNLERKLKNKVNKGIHDTRNIHVHKIGYDNVDKSDNDDNDKNDNDKNDNDKNDNDGHDHDADLSKDKSGSVKSKRDGYFVRLSTRSPKDATLKRSEMVKKLIRKKFEENASPKKSIQSNLKQRCNSSSGGDKDSTSSDNICDDAKESNENDGDIEENNETLWLVHCFHEALKVHSGKEAIELIASSKRSYHDLSTRTLLQQSEEEFKMVVAIRKWVNIYPGFEFRAFVCNQKITALTQYFQACFIKELKQRKDEMEGLIMILFDKVKQVLHDKCARRYVIDFAYCLNEERNAYEMKVVELNHFERTTGAGLFDWKEDEKRLLGEEPYQFRIIESSIPNSQSSLYAPLRAILQQARIECGLAPRECEQSKPQHHTDEGDETLRILNRKFFLLILSLFAVIVMLTLYAKNKRTFTIK